MAFDRRELPDLKFHRVVSYNLKAGEDIVQAELERHAQSNQYLGPDPVLPYMAFNADGTIAIKGEAAEQLKALIREVWQERWEELRYRGEPPLWLRIKWAWQLVRGRGYTG